MAFRNRTLRRMSPVARKLARLAGEADSLGRRLKNLVEEVRDVEFQASALKSAKGAGLVEQKDNPLFEEEKDDGN